MFIRGKVLKLNQLISNEGPYTFMTDILGEKFPLNYTSTKYP